MKGVDLFGRHEWDLDPSLLYFASCARYPLLKTSMQAGIEEIVRKARRPHTVDYNGLREKARSAVATHLFGGVDVHRVHFYPCVSFVVTNVLKAFRYR